MRATEFAEFFDLWIELNSEENINEEDYEPTRYIVRDTMNYWVTFPRFIDDASDLIWCADLMIDDSVLYDLSDWYGFEHNNKEKTIYEDAADYATEHNVSYADILRVIAGYEDIEDDVA